MVNINIGKMISNTGKAIVDKTSRAFHLDIFSNEKSDEDKFFQLNLDIIGEETFSADCDVTDHYVESNTAYQDQISLKPKTYTVQGEVGELVWYQNDQNEQILGQVSQRLESLISFLPIRSKSFNTMKHKAVKALQWVDTASNVASKLTNLYNDTAEGKQQQAYINLCKYRDERQHLNISTPWGVLENYVITNLKLTQPKETKDKTYISLTFKELRTTSLSFVDFDPDKYQGNAVFENQPPVDNGKTYGSDASVPTEEYDRDGIVYDSCSVWDNEGSEYNLEFNKKTKDIDVYGIDDNDMPFEIKKGTPNWYKAIDSGRAQCEVEISHWQAYGLELDK